MRTYKFRLYPKKHQVRKLNYMLSLSCDLYNTMLQQRIYAHQQGKKVNYNSQQNELPELKNMIPEYKEIHSLPVCCPKAGQII